MKKVLRVLAIVILSIFIVSLFALQRVRNKYDNVIYNDILSVPKTKVALVLGAGLKKNKEPSDALADRVETAAELYKNKVVDKLLMSGDNGSIYYNEVEAMKRLAVKLGVAKTDIFLDYAGFRTYDSCYRARDIFSLDRVIIVTQAFHLPRALFICNELGIKADGVEADKHVYLKAKFWEIRELAAQIVAFFEVKVFQPKPKFLGKKVLL